MSLIPWSRPSRVPAIRSRSDLDDMFRSFFEGLPWAGEGDGAFVPSIDVKDDDDEIVVTAELPGIEKDDIDVQVRGDEVVLRGEKREETREEKDNWVRKEIVAGSFLRRIALPGAVDAEHADAKMDNGVLTIRFPKATREASTSIKVS